MRIKDSVPFARRSLRRGDEVGVRFESDICPGRVVTATRCQAIVKLLKVRDGRPVERSFDGEFLLRFVPADPAAAGCTGAWRVAGTAPSSDHGIVYKDFNLHYGRATI